MWCIRVFLPYGWYIGFLGAIFCDGPGDVLPLDHGGGLLVPLGCQKEDSGWCTAFSQGKRAFSVLCLCCCGLCAFSDVVGGLIVGSPCMPCGCSLTPAFSALLLWRSCRGKPGRSAAPSTVGLSGIRPDGCKSKTQTRWSMHSQ